jgi:hypothetical protein
MSAIPFYGVAGNGAEQVGFLAMAMEMLDRLVDQHLRLLARAVGAE